MKEIKAYVHRSRIADTIEAIRTAGAVGTHNLTVYAVLGSLPPLDDSERHFSIDLGQEVIEEFKLELHCEDGDVALLCDAIRAAARTGQARAGWIYVVDIVSAQPIR